jgi:uncharacterized membrane protein
MVPQTGTRQMKGKTMNPREIPPFLGLMIGFSMAMLGFIIDSADHLSWSHGAWAMGCGWAGLALVIVSLITEYFIIADLQRLALQEKKD